MSIPLLITKLTIPPQRPKLVLRPRLMTKLDEALSRRQRLILVSAKAGSGKTTLVGEWIHRQARPAAWLALDENDNDPRRFFGYLVAALQQLGLEIGTAVLNQLEMQQLPHAEDLLAELVNDIAGNAAPCFLVLDDYHLIHNEWIQRAIAFFVEHQPQEVTLILVTRVDPPLPLARLRGRDQISEIRGDNLRFTFEESFQYLTKVMKLDLTAETVSALETRTEGWIVGLQMAAISMHGRMQTGDLVAFIEAFSGTNRYILDYLMEEVLGQQSPAVQDFLLQTSILRRMCGSLCDAVHLNKWAAVEGRPAAGRQAQSMVPSGSSAGENPESAMKAVEGQYMLAHLERTNLFVVPLDDKRQWYRYHHLFADLLNNTLRQQRSAAEIRELHRRASLWHQGQGDLEEALVHAIKAQDYERAAAMIDENIVRMLSRSEAPVLLSWIDKLPKGIAVSRPWVDVYRAYTMALSGRSDEAEQVIDDVEKRIDPGTPRFSEILGQIAAIRSFTANLHGDAVRTIEMASLAEKKLPEEHLNARGMIAYALADTYFARDDMERASQESLKMLAIGEKLGRLLMSVTALCDLAATRRVQGRLHQAQELYHRAYRLLAERNGLDSRLRCPYEIGMAGLLFEWNQLDAAYEHARTGIEYGQRFSVPSLLTSGYLIQIRILQVKGDLDNARETLHSAERFTQTYPLQLATSIAFNSSQVQFWLAAGDMPAASRWAEKCKGGSELEQIALARLLLAQGDITAAQQLLERQRTLAEAGNRSGRLIEIMCLQAVAHQSEGEFAEADTTLAEALALAQPEGYMRLFLDLGYAIIEPLQRLAAEEKEANIKGLKRTRIGAAYLQALLGAFQQESALQPGSIAGVNTLRPAPSISPAAALTEREKDVLELLAEGISNKEIAARLVVAPSTVKQHLKNIYGKLDVHSRTQAVHRGRELGLI